jgi:CheY-like chemotaxis protein
VDEQRLILVVEDDEATGRFLAENLAADGFRVAAAASAGEALRAIEVRQPALVLLDLRLEGGSGLDVLDRVRSADGLASRLDPDLPVIVLTGRSGEADRVRSFARGADDHLEQAITVDQTVVLQPDQGAIHLTLVQPRHFLTRHRVRTDRQLQLPAVDEARALPGEPAQDGLIHLLPARHAKPSSGASSSSRAPGRPRGPASG